MITAQDCGLRAVTAEPANDITATQAAPSFAIVPEATDYRVPFDAAEAYRAKGWTNILPLPPRRKSSPPKGFTGHGGKTVTTDDIRRWRAEGYDGGTVVGNIALRPPPIALGIDVDCYDEKRGAATLADLEADLGPLPLTWISTSRDDGSGIRLYRVPAGQPWPGIAGPDIEIIQQGHRYAVVAPSIHPDTGRPYVWITPDGEITDEPPMVGALPALPDSWCRHLLGTDADGATVAAKPGSLRADREHRKTARAWLDSLPGGEPCAYVGRLAADVNGAARREEGNAHDSTRDRVLPLLRAGETGHPGVPSALAHGREVYISTVAADRGGAAVAGAEWDRLTEGGAMIIAREPGARAGRGCDCTTARAPVINDEIVPSAAANARPSWSPEDLSAILDGSHEALEPTLLPRTDGRCLLYPGKVHSVHGESESGKSLVLQAEAARLLLARQDVVYIDYESTAATVVGRLRQMGVPVEIIRDHLAYIRPERSPLDPAEVDAWHALLDQPAALIVLDGVTEALSTMGRSTIDNDEVTGWIRRVPRALAERTGAAVVLVDHVTKSTEGRGRFAIGAQAKMAALDGASYSLEVVEPLGRGMRGVLRLWIGKDREGNVRPFCGRFNAADRTQLAATIVVDSTAGPITVEVQPPEDLVGTERKPFRPTYLMEQISRALEGSPNALTSNALVKGSDYVTGNGQAKRTALDLLVTEGYVDRALGARGSALHTTARPYREADEPGPSQRLSGAVDRLGLGPAIERGTQDPVKTATSPGLRTQSDPVGPSGPGAHLGAATDTPATATLEDSDEAPF